jgi:hypothetical protein
VVMLCVLLWLCHLGKQSQLPAGSLAILYTNTLGTKQYRVSVSLSLAYLAYLAYLAQNSLATAKKISAEVKATPAFDKNLCVCLSVCVSVCVTKINDRISKV